MQTSENLLWLIALPLFSSAILLLAGKRANSWGHIMGTIVSASTFTIGIIREGKVPPDFRVPLTPKQCNEIQTRFPNVKVLVQTSPIRTFKDEEYQKEGIEIVENLNDCDIIFGVKEVPISYLIEKGYCTCSHLSFIVFLNLIANVWLP